MLGLSLGTGLYRLLNIGLMVVLAGALIFAAWTAIKNNWIDEGKEQVTEQIQDQNQKLDEKVEETNTNVVRDVVRETTIIERNSKDIEYVIRNAPSERISNVTMSRIERVREQQRAVREASQNAE